jgi:low affinity Fe/Cu permease
MSNAVVTRSGSTTGNSLHDRFNRIADRITDALGSFIALAASVLIVVVWALTGPIFNFSDTWQLFINTGTTVVTFWMVFVIQNSANRNSKALHLKLDEVIRSIEGARNTFITLEQEPEEKVQERAKELAEVAEESGDEDVTTARTKPTRSARTDR